MGVNNVAAYAPVSSFVCSDPPSKFHFGIFLDPKIMCFLPTPKLSGVRAKLRAKDPNGDFRYLEDVTSRCPNTWGFERRSWLACDDSWFLTPGAAWGNHAKGVERTGEPKTVNTMLLAIRVLQYLGARKIFLLGVDFYMDPTVGPKDNYAFGELREPNAVQSNNDQYRISNDWLKRLRPVFERWGFSVYNCNSESRLEAFDYVPFNVALKICRGKVPEGEWDLENWYWKP
jgi:hypothetical protein